jgi:hypothetical protein
LVPDNIITSRFWGLHALHIGGFAFTGEAAGDAFVICGAGEQAGHRLIPSRHGRTSAATIPERMYRLGRE